MLSDDELTLFVAEMCEDFQLPPYLDDAVIRRSAKEKAERLIFLKDDADFTADMQARSLLKNAVYYDINHRYEEFEANYAPLILSWQLGGKTT